MAFTALCRRSYLRVSDIFNCCFPCLADPAQRCSLYLRLVLVILHLVYGGVLFLFDKDLVEKTRREPWYTALYLLLWIATLVQYFITAYSSPGYVLDAKRAVNKANLSLANRDQQRQDASNNYGSFIVQINDPSRGNLLGSDIISWSKRVTNLYLPSTPARDYICSYCHVEQPPRTKHCHYCDRCILKFDHHCSWLGNCIGYGNHCRFWWYLCEESALCSWTSFLYISYLWAHISHTWWKSAIMIGLVFLLSMALIFLLLLLAFHSYLILTNQTTYEFARRKRISYLRHVPRRVRPFSRGMCRNLCRSCFGRGGYMERVRTRQELEERSLPYTCSDILTCRCCF